jgi:hypothetical protein
MMCDTDAVVKDGKVKEHDVCPSFCLSPHYRELILILQLTATGFVTKFRFLIHGKATITGITRFGIVKELQGTVHVV